MPSLNEIFGKDKGSKEEFDLGDLKELLGEKMPDMPYNRVGKVRLLRALRNRFGEGFRNMKQLQGLLKQFDHEVKTDLELRKIRKIKLED